MIKVQIKSMLRNKINRIYLIILIVAFFILNIAINIKPIIDEYFDTKLENHLQESLGQYSEADDYKDLEKSRRTILINSSVPDSGDLTDQEKEMIKKLPHVENLETKDIELPQINTIVKFEYVIVDDWKNCHKVEKMLNKKGYITFIDNKLLEEYTTIRYYENIILYTLDIILLLIVIICYVNILNNEDENMEILKIIGYQNNDIIKIKVVFLTILTIISLVIGSVVSGIGLAIIKNFII